MCRWGCTTVSTTYMCKWCGTRYCGECLKGDFSGLMVDPTKCRVCFQLRCQGNRVEYVPGQKIETDGAKSGKKGKGSKGKSKKGGKEKGGASKKKGAKKKKKKK